MKLIQELKMEGIEGIIDLSNVNPMEDIKLFISGELAAEASDRRFLLRINKLSTGYQSDVIITGSSIAYPTGEWDTTGFYLGRNGWGLDASLSIEYTISSVMSNQRYVGHGEATFGMSNTSILGYTCNGCLVGKSPRENVSIVVTGGLFKGKVKAYSF